MSLPVFILHLLQLHLAHDIKNSGNLSPLPVSISRITKILPLSIVGNQKMKLRFYALVVLSLVWFVFGSMLIFRGSFELNELAYYKGKLQQIGTTITTDLRGRQKEILYFNVGDLTQTLGIYHSTKKDYDYYLNQLKKGDMVEVYFNENGGKADTINLHVYQLEHNGQIMLDHKQRTRTDRKVGFILYGVGLIFSIAPIWIYRTKMNK